MPTLNEGCFLFMACDFFAVHYLKCYTVKNHGYELHRERLTKGSHNY